MARLFGTDGVRGVANEELTPLLAMQLGQAGATVLTKENEHRPTIMVGCDTRISGDMLANALMAGICSVGANAVYVGVIPTPAVAYLTKKYKVEAGDTVFIEKLNVEADAEITFDKVVAVGAEDGIKVGAPYVEGATVIAKAIKNGKAKKITVFTYKPKKNEKRKMGHRQPYTKVEIAAINA